MGSIKNRSKNGEPQLKISRRSFLRQSSSLLVANAAGRVGLHSRIVGSDNLASPLFQSRAGSE